MIKLSELKEKTEKAFEDLKIPEPPIKWKDLLTELKEQKLQRKYERCLMDMRIEQAKMLGFEPILVSDMVEMLMGEKHTNEIIDKDKDRQVHEWVYNHFTGDEYDSKMRWGSSPTNFYLVNKVGPWWLPPFLHKEIWRCKFGKLDYLKRDIPYGVLLRINELKKLKLFNAFHILAPIEAWERKTDIDPIVVGSVWEMPVNDEDKYSSAGDAQHFFVAQW